MVVVGMPPGRARPPRAMPHRGSTEAGPCSKTSPCVASHAGGTRREDEVRTRNERPTTTLKPAAMPQYEPPRRSRQTCPLVRATKISTRTSTAAHRLLMVLTMVVGRTGTLRLNTTTGVAGQYLIPSPIHSLTDASSSKRRSSPGMDDSRSSKRR